VRWFIALVFVLALGTLRIVGCGNGDEEPSTACTSDQDCYDLEICDTTGRCRSIFYRTFCDFDGIPSMCGSEDGVFESGLCTKNPCDDGNPCTGDPLPRDDGSCVGGSRCDTSGPCEWKGGNDGVCVDGVCGENPCLDIVCDDGDTCSSEHCDFRDGTCHFFLAGFDGDRCSSSNVASGICIDAVCEENLCPEMVCDDGNLCTTDFCRINQCHNILKNCSDSTVCTDDACDPETGGCIHEPAHEGADCCLKDECVPCLFCWEEPCPSCCGTRCADYGSCHNGVCQ